jgi:Pectate lyase superfamily protein
MPKYPYRELGVGFDRNFRNDLNANFDDIEADLRDIQNDLSAKDSAAHARMTQIENDSIERDNDLDARIDNLILSAGDSSPEVADARYDSRMNTNYPTLKDRLDAHSDEIGILNKKTDVIVSVKEYGAKGDGVSDDTTAIQNAINDVNIKGGGIVYFPTGTYMISSTLIIPSNKITLQGLNNAGTIIKAKIAMTNMVSITNQLRVSIRDIQINGNNLASVGIYAQNTGMLWMDNVVVQKCTDKGIFLDDNTYMFNLNNLYVLNNTNYGIYVANNCAGSKMNMVIAEENGINLRIGYTRMVQITASTFQRYNNIGNVLVQAGWDITFDTCWFESNDNNLTGETYDLKLESTDGSGNIGHSIRVLNCSFKGTWGDGTPGKTKHCIIDGYTDTILQNNYIDGTNGGYTSGKWYENNNANTKVLGINNQVNGSQTYTLSNYAMWHLVVGSVDDSMVGFKHIRIAEKITMPAINDLGYDYDGRLFHSSVRKKLKFATDGKWWEILQAQYMSAPPTSGTYKVGDLVLNNAPTAGGYIGWVCVSAGTPGIWKGFGAIQT